MGHAGTELGDTLDACQSPSLREEDHHRTKYNIRMVLALPVPVTGGLVRRLKRLVLKICRHHFQ